MRPRYAPLALVGLILAGCFGEPLDADEDDGEGATLDQVDSVRALGDDGAIAVEEAPAPPPEALARAVPSYATITVGGRLIELPLGLKASAVRLPAGDLLDPALIELGNLLFFDRRLSRTKAMSCATCHVPANGYAAKAINRGVGGNLLARTTPPATNRLLGTENNWLGANTLEQQSTRPITNALEMGLTAAQLLEVVRAVPGYVERFNRLVVLGQLPAPAISVANIGKAIATFQRSLLTGASRVDRWEAGDTTALTAKEIAGRALFRGKARCTECHGGPNYTDEGYHNIVSGCPSTGPCRHPTSTFEAGRFLVTGNPADIGKFKTPSLRNVALRGPYFHSGIDATLEQVVHGYNVASDLEDEIGQDPELIFLDLTPTEEAQLVAFLRALTGTIPVSASLSRAGVATSTPWRERFLLSPDVFDVAFYRTRNADIPGVATMTDDELRAHWIASGASAGRRGTLAFYPVEYDRYLQGVDPAYVPAAVSGSYAPAIRRYLDRDRRAGWEGRGRYVTAPAFFDYRHYRRLQSDRLAFSSRAQVIHDFLTFGVPNRLDGRETYPVGVAFLNGGVLYRTGATNTYCQVARPGSTTTAPVWPYIPAALRSVGTC